MKSRCMRTNLPRAGPSNPELYRQNNFKLLIIRRTYTFTLCIKVRSHQARYGTAYVRTLSRRTPLPSSRANTWWTHPSSRADTWWAGLLALQNYTSLWHYWGRAVAEDGLIIASWVCNQYTYTVYSSTIRCARMLLSCIRHSGISILAKPSND